MNKLTNARVPYHDGFICASRCQMVMTTWIPAEFIYAAFMPSQINDFSDGPLK